MKIGKPKKHGFDAGRLARIGTWMDRYVSERKYPGSSILIAHKGKLVYNNQAGMRDVEAGKPFERDTIARIYSMTKPITSTAIMMLAERGLFHLEAPVSDFIPSFTNCQALVPDAQRIDQVEPAPAPTLHQLLTHTSGLTYGFNPGLASVAMTEAGVQFRSDQGMLADMVDRAAALPLAFQPGSRWEYSVSLDILGRVVEIVSGKTLDEYFRSEIFEPLEMAETGFSVPAGTMDRFASLYTPLEGDAMAINEASRGDETLRLVDQAKGTAYESATLFAGGGGLVGTIDDYMRFAEMLRLGGALGDARLLSPKTVAFMMRNHLPGDIASMGPKSFAEQPMDGVGFGLGGSVLLDPGRAGAPGSVGDFSWGGMASTFFWIDRKTDMSVVFFTQLSPSSSYPARAELKALVHGAMTS